ncbi:unnamed protein product [Lactuca virosa]|uniref:PUL domain-containing protein n=1 Tax=Lactuca virosa TaxID=75947 RepID=A0AAU9PEW8_9ASTR|nr:unnamed protein product [Lactuca virosa]
MPPTSDLRPTPPRRPTLSSDTQRHPRLLSKLLKSWPLSMMFPVIDILRMVILHPDGSSVLKHVIDENDIFMDLIKKVTNNPLPPNLLTSIRAVVNLFKNSSFHIWLHNHRVEIFDAFASCYSSPNKNVQISYYTLVLNYDVLLIEKKDEEGQSHVLSAALEIAEGETLEVDAKYRALVAIGSLPSSAGRRLVISSDGVWDALSGGQQPSTVHQVMTN